MRTRLREIGVLGGLLVIGVSLVGCHGSGTPAVDPNAPPPTQIQTAAPGTKPVKPQGGGVPDMNDNHPAPAGVKTGVEKN
jgi:hypothetical protein